MKETLNNNLAELTKAVDKAILDIDEMETTIKEESERLDARLEGDGAKDIYDAIYQDGVEAGKKSEYDAFWDAYQHNGTRRQYSRGFAGEGWVIDVFKPKYDARPTYASSMFEACNLMKLDLYQYCKDSGWILDFSECTQMISMCMYGSPYKMPTIDTRSAQSLVSMFSYNPYIQYIHELILRDSGEQNCSNMFVQASKLHTLNIVGTIGLNGFNVSWSPLNKASLTSIVNALSTTTTGLTVTLRLDAVNTAFETTPGAADGSTSSEWLSLAATKSNWTISLINS